MNCWVIAAACCVINFLALGIARLAPLLYVASMERYNVNRARAAFPFVICYTLRTMAGPIIGIVGRKYGLRSVTLFGCVVSFIGIGGCYFAEEIMVVNILWGGVYGIGFGFSSALLPLVLDHAFEEKHKTTANGISLSGSSLGGFLIPPIAQVTLAEYGLSGTFLITSGLMLHCIPACLLLSVSNSKKIVTEKQESHGIMRNKKIDQHTNSEIHCIPPNNFSHQAVNTNKTEKTKLSKKNSKYNKNSSMSGYDNAKFEINDENAFFEKSLKPISFAESIPNDYSQIQNINSGKNLSNIRFKTISKSMEPSGTPELLQVTVINEHDKINGTFLESKISKQDKTETLDIKEDKSHQSLLRSLSLFFDPTYFLIMVTQSAYAFHAVVVWTIIVDVSRDKGVDRSTEIFCAMVLPLADMIGRLSLGWITDRGYMSKIQFSVVSYLLFSLFTVLFVYVYGFALMMLNIVLFGFVSGGLCVIFPGIVCEFIDSHNRCMGMSNRLLLLAPLSFATSPLIRFFREERGSYDGVFYVLFIISVLCTGMSALIPRFAKRSKAKLDAEKT